MKYIKAQDVLPEKIVKMIQKYIDGNYLYIPRKCDNHKAWGENSGIRDTLKIRNKEIYKKYINGTDIHNLYKEYFLSEKSIRRIIRTEKLLCS